MKVDMPSTNRGVRAVTQQLERRICLVRAWNMNSSRSTLAAALVAFVLGCSDNAQDSSPFTLSVDALRQLSPETTAGFTYEESHGAILVTVIDRYKDGHIHRLVLGDLTRAEALALLAQKQAEFERAALPIDLPEHRN